MVEHTAALSSAPPDFLTLDEAAAVLRVGRSTAYREANAFERSGGRTGIPEVRYGKLFRVPRCRLEEQLGGPLTWPLPNDAIDPPDLMHHILTWENQHPAD